MSSPDLVALIDFSDMYQATPNVRVQVIRRGVRAVEVKDLVRMMVASQDKRFKILKLSIAITASNIRKWHYDARMR